MDISVIAFGSAGYYGMVALRDRVLREPLGLAFTEEHLAAEKDYVHLALRQDGLVVATLLLVPPGGNGVARIRQMAVDPRFERRGFGTALMHRGEVELRRLHAARVELAAREPAVGFYERFGYVAQGKPFIDLTIAHVLMAKRL